MSVVATTNPTETVSDQDWFDAFLTRLGDRLDAGDAMGRLRVIRSAKLERPHLTAWFVGIEFMCPHVDGAMEAKKVALEIAKISRVTNNITLNVNGNLIAQDGAVVGLDSSIDKSTGRGGDS